MGEAKLVHDAHRLIGPLPGPAIDEVRILPVELFDIVSEGVGLESYTELINRPSG